MSVCVHVPLGDRAYDIQIGQGLLGKSAQYIRPFLRRSKVVLSQTALWSGFICLL